MNKVLPIFFFLINTLCFSQKIDETKINYINPEFETEIKEAKTLITDLMNKKSIPGLSITVANKNEILWSEGFGFADLENKTPVRIYSKFRIGSISKSLTSIALGKLIEAGRIHLNDKVEKLVPYFPKKKYPITVQELASHTSGIRSYNYKSGEYFSDVRYNTIKESIEIFKGDTLLFEPKTKYGYSSYGYVLLSAVIEEVTGQHFLDYMQNSVFEPMEMYNTLPDFNDKIIDNRVQFYQLNEGSVINARYVDNSNKWAGGGFLSSSLDLAKMSQHLIRNDKLKKETVELLWTPTVLMDGEKTNSCLGWRRDTTDLGNTYLHHGGSSIGGRSFLLIYPKEEIIIAITCNLFARFNQSFVLKVADKFKK